MAEGVTEERYFVSGIFEYQLIFGKGTVVPLFIIVLFSYLCIELKKVFTIVMLFLFLLNVLGFYGIFLGLQFKTAQDANRNLDEEQYSDVDEVTFKVPLSVPYYSDNQDFERVTGEFEHDGEVYRLVKQKYSSDTLTLICIKDSQAKKINQALADYVKTFTDKPVNAKQQNSKSVQSFCKDYMTSVVSLESQSSGWKNPVIYVHQIQRYLSFDPTRIKYPPKSPFSI